MPDQLPKERVPHRAGRNFSAISLRNIVILIVRRHYKAAISEVTGRNRSDAIARQDLNSTTSTLPGGHMLHSLSFCCTNYSNHSEGIQLIVDGRRIQGKREGRETGFEAGLKGLKALEIGANQYDKEGALSWSSKRKKKQARKNGPPQFKIPAVAVADQISFSLK